MALRDWISNSGVVANAKVAKVASDTHCSGDKLAKIATLALASGEKNEIAGDNLPSFTDQTTATPAPSTNEANEEALALPSWCRAGCKCLDVIPGAGPGCVRPLEDGSWREEWRRLDTMGTCPDRLH